MHDRTRERIIINGIRYSHLLIRLSFVSWCVMVEGMVLMHGLSEMDLVAHGDHLRRRSLTVSK